jgi:predicted RNA binding protein YcfA (HicA-like mRNA interferase family)
MTWRLARDDNALCHCGPKVVIADLIRNPCHCTAIIALFMPVGTITTVNSKDLIKQLEADGWVLRGSKGSHHVFTHPSKLGHLSIPHPKKDLGIGLLHKLLKQAGLR